MTKPTRPAVPKLGELLEARGKLDREALFRALRHQRTQGGRLGTSLLELGLVSEDDLLNVLSDQLKLPFASPEDLRAVPEEVAKLVPAKVAHARLAVPMRATSSKLEVAMANPRDLAALDELAFVSGRRIVPLVSTEMRIHDALSRVYRIDIPSRFVKLLDHQNRARFMWGRKEEGTEEATLAAPLSVAPPTPAAPQPLPPPPPPPVPERTAPVAPAAPTLSGLAAPRDIEERLVDPADRDAVAAALLDFLRGRFERALLLMVRRDEAVGWVALGTTESADPAEIRIPLTEPSVLVALRDGTPHHRGALAPLPAHAPLDRWLSAGNALDLLALPLRVRERLVGAILVANQGAPFDPAAVDELHRLALRASMALELLVLRQKLRRS